MQTRPAIDREIQCDSVELIESCTVDGVNNNTTNTANEAQNAPQSATHDSYESPKLEELDDDE